MVATRRGFLASLLGSAALAVTARYMPALLERVRVVDAPDVPWDLAATATSFTSAIVVWRVSADGKNWTEPRALSELQDLHGMKVACDFAVYR